MASGRISLLIDSPFRDMLVLLNAVPRDAAKTAMKHARAEAAPIWKEETAGRATTRLEQRILVDSSRVGFTARNVSLRAGAIGRLSSGTPVSRLAAAAEFGMAPGAPVQQKSRKGKMYTRRAGRTFAPRRSSGKVFYPAAADSSARVLSVLIQSWRRSLFDALDGKK